MNLTSLLTRNFKDPETCSISGHAVPIVGIIPNVILTIRGKTLRYDIHVTPKLDGFYDLVLGASIIRHLASLCQKAKRTFFGWFLSKKKSLNEMNQGKVLDQQQETDAALHDRKRRKRAAEEAAKKKQAQQLAQKQTTDSLSATAAQSL
jgi:hypothetical protein